MHAAPDAESAEPRTIRRRLVGLLACAVLALLGAPVQAVEPVPILVLTSHDAPPYEQALAGWQAVVHQSRLEVAVSVHRLAGDSARALRPLQEARQARVRLVVALGSFATRAAILGAGDLPIVTGLVASTGAVPQAPNVTGVTLEFPLEIHAQWLRRLLPAARTLGVLFNPVENRQRVEAASPIFARAGLKLQAQEVRAPTEIPAALEAIGRRVDAIWGFPDTLVLTPETAKQLLLFSFRSRLPLVGPSAAWVKAGALYTLDWDYEDVGRQCGEVSLRLLQGVAPGAIPIAPPRKVLYVLNQRTAAHMKIEFPDELVRGAREIF